MRQVENLEVVKENYGQLAIRRKVCEEMNGKKKRITACLLTVCMAVTALALPGTGSKVKASSEIEPVYKILKEYVQEIAEYRGEEKTYAPKEGYVFAGWYEDAECETTPLSNDTKSGGAYAKYVPKQIMNVQAQISTNLRDADIGNDTSGSIRFVSTVDSDTYSKVGFRFVLENAAIEREITTVYDHLYASADGVTVDECIPENVGCSLSKHFVTWGFWNIPESAFYTHIEATPYWITLDGTKVYGDTVTKTVHEGIFGTTWKESSNMSYDAAGDQYISTNDQGPYLYSRAAVGNVGVSATIKGPGNAGITVRVGNESKQFMANANELVFANNHNFGDTAFIMPGTFYDKKGEACVKGMVQDGYFYLFFDDEEMVCRDMSTLFDGYNKDSSEVEIGFSSFYSSVCFKNVKCLSPNEVDAVKTTKDIMPKAGHFWRNGNTEEFTMWNDAYFYGKKVTGNVGVSASLRRNDEGNSNAGVTVRVGSESKQFMANTGELLYMNNLDGGTISTSIIAPNTFYDKNGEAEVKGLVKDGYFYLFFDEEEILCRNMADLFPGYDSASSQVEIGLCGWYSPGVIFSNVTYLSSNEVNAVETTQDVLPKINKIWYDRNVAGYGMWDDAYLYGRKAVGDVSVSATITSSNKQWAGVTVRVGSESRQFMSSGTDDFIIMKNHSADKPEQSKIGSVYNADGTGSVKGVVKEGIFYLYFNDTQVLTENMNTMFSNYDVNGSQVEIGLCGWYSDAKFTNVQYLFAEDVVLQQ